MQPIKFSFHMSVCVASLTHEVTESAEALAGALWCLFLWRSAAERSGRLYRMMMIKFTSTQNSTAHTELFKVMGMECSRSQACRVTMSCSMAFIWKWVPRMPHTWKS